MSDGLGQRERVLRCCDFGGEPSIIDEIDAAAAEFGEVKRDLTDVDLKGRLGGGGYRRGEGVIVDRADEAAGVEAAESDGTIDDAAGAVVASAEVEAEAAGGDDVIVGELAQVCA